MHPRAGCSSHALTVSPVPRDRDVLVTGGRCRWCGWGETWAAAGDVGRDVSLTRAWLCDERGVWTVGVDRRLAVSLPGSGRELSSSAWLPSSRFKNNRGSSLTREGGVSSWPQRGEQSTLCGFIHTLTRTLISQTPHTYSSQTHTHSSQTHHTYTRISHTHTSITHHTHSSHTAHSSFTHHTLHTHLTHSTYTHSSQTHTLISNTHSHLKHTTCTHSSHIHSSHTHHTHHALISHTAYTHLSPTHHTYTLISHTHITHHTHTHLSHCTPQCHCSTP